MNIYKNLSQTAKLMVWGIGICFAVFLVVGGIVVYLWPEIETLGQFALGLFTGCGFSVIKLVLMDRSIGKTVGMNEAKAKNVGTFHFIVRYVLTFVYIGVVILLRAYVGSIGAILGLLSLQFSAYIANHLLVRRERRESQRLDGEPPPPEESQE